MDSETTKAFNPTTADDLTDTALEAIQGRKDILALIQVAHIAAAALDTRGMRATARRLRELCAKVRPHTT